MSFTYNGLSQYIILSKSAYENLEAYSDQAIYFIRDTQEIYRGTINYSKGFIICTALPQNPLTSKAYINTTDGTLNVYTGSTWLTFANISNNVSSVVLDTNGNPVVLSVNGSAIVEYIETVMGITNLSDISNSTMYTNGQVPLTLVDDKNNKEITCVYTKAQDSNASLGITYTYTTAIDGTTYSTKTFIPASYNDYSNIMEILIDLGESEISNAKDSIT